MRARDVESTVALGCSEPTDSNNSSGRPELTQPCMEGIDGVGLCEHGWCWVTPQPVGYSFEAAATGPDGHVWAAAKEGVVVEWDGHQFQQHALEPDAPSLNDIWVSQNGEVWVVGYAGFVAVRKHDRFEKIDTGVEHELFAVAGDEHRVFIGGANVLLEWDGQAFINHSAASSWRRRWYDVAVANGQVWAVAPELTLQHDGQQWLEHPGVGALRT